MLGILRRRGAETTTDPGAAATAGPLKMKAKKGPLPVSPTAVEKKGRPDAAAADADAYHRGAALRASSVTASYSSGGDTSPSVSPGGSPPRPPVGPGGSSSSRGSEVDAEGEEGAAVVIKDPHQDPHHPPKADPPTTVTAFELEGASSAAAAIPVPCACLPLSLGKPAYQHRRVDEGTIRTYMRAFGDRSMSYVHFHRCQKHYELPGVGLVSYCWVLSYTGWAAFVTIDPLCKPEDTAALLAAFERDVPGMKQYVAVSDRVATALRGMGYDTTRFALDYYADLDQYKVPKGRRRYLNEGRNHGLVVKELTWAQVEEQGLAGRIQEISDNWLKTRQGGNRELQLMTWPFYHGDEWASRKFYLFEREDLGGQMLAYIFFTPCFREGKIIGYQANILRRDPKIAKPTYALDFLLLQCHDTFKQEGLAFLSLSIAPLYGIGEDESDSRMLRAVFRLWYNWPEALMFYAFKGLGKHKDHFKVNRVEPLWACTKGTRSALGIQQLILTVTNTIPVSKPFHGVQS